MSKTTIISVAIGTSVLILAPWAVKVISFYLDYLDWAIKL